MAKLYDEDDEYDADERAFIRGDIKKKLGLALAVLLLVVIIVVILIAGREIEKRTPSKEEMSIEEYYGEIPDNCLPAYINRERTDFYIEDIDGRLYIKYDDLTAYFDDRFYWESNENVLLYASADEKDLYSVPLGEKKYYLGKSLEETGYAAVKQVDGLVYVSLEFADTVSGIDYEETDNSVRCVQFRTDWESENFVQVDKDCELRYEADIKSPILVHLTEGDELYLVEEGEEFTTLQTEDGVRGFVQNKYIGDIVVKNYEYNAKTRALDHNLVKNTVCLLWHQVTVESANDNVAGILADTKGVNVISPTWFYINDNDGNLYDIASKDYVTYCHSQGVSVWGLVSNLENTEIDTGYILTHTSARQNLVNNIVAKAIQYDMDGINLDLENISLEDGEGFVELVRELGLKCHANGIILSVDNPVPSGFSAYYDRPEQACFADYIILMAYDEHWSGSDEGSVASITFTEDAVSDTISEGVDKSQIILGNPFYTRVWCETPKDDTEIDSAEAASDDYVNYDLSSEAVGMSEAESRISSNGANTVYLSDVGQNFAQYEKDGNTYKIWLEDETSIMNRLGIMKEYEVAGTAFWKAGLEKTSVWDTILQYVQ